MTHAISNEDKIFKSENFSKRSLEGHVFNSCSFNSCDFSESILRNAKFSACVFMNCNLSLTKLDACRFQEVQFVDCKIVGAEFFKCDRAFFSVSFKKCLLSYCNFSDLNMKNTHFDGSKIQQAHFTNTVLSGADFADTDLSGTIFHNCDLCKADFSSAVRYNIDPQTNKIKKARFSLPEAVGLLQGFDIIIV
jgi:fluoroquinolone resistance protein